MRHYHTGFATSSGFAKIATLIVIALVAIVFLVFSFRSTTADKSEPYLPVVTHYADMAFAIYSDSLTLAVELQKAVDQLLEDPTASTLAKAQQVWLAARIPYGQSEVYRFSNANVDEWEGRVNAWPLDEGLIDYVSSSYGSTVGNQFGLANVIADSDNYPTINATLLRDQLHEAGSEEANVATGYHAIEFLLWGQDLNQQATDKGLRPASDYLTGDACTHGNCERRRTYLRVVTEMLVEDLQLMVDDWDSAKTGNYREALLSEEPSVGLRRMLRGMGEMSLGELASERMLVGLAAHDQEEEHSCFSDSTHTDVLENARGVRNIYRGEYQRIDGTLLSGPSISSLVVTHSEPLDGQLNAALDSSLAAAMAIVDKASSTTAPEHYDQLLSANNPAGNALVKATINALVAQTDIIQQVSVTLGINSLEVDPGTCFNADGSDNGQCNL